MPVKTPKRLPQETIDEIHRLGASVAQGGEGLQVGAISARLDLSPSIVSYHLIGITRRKPYARPPAPAAPVSPPPEPDPMPVPVVVADMPAPAVPAPEPPPAPRLPELPDDPGQFSDANLRTMEFVRDHPDALLADRLRASDMLKRWAERSAEQETRPLDDRALVACIRVMLSALPPKLERACRLRDPVPPIDPNRLNAVHVEAPPAVDLDSE